MLNQIALLEPFQHFGYQDNDDDRGCDESQRSYDPANKSISMEAGISGCVDADGAWSGLRDRDQIQKVLLGEPARGLADFLQKRKGGKPAADGEEPPL